MVVQGVYVFCKIVKIILVTICGVLCFSNYEKKKNMILSLTILSGIMVIMNLIEIPLDIYLGISCITSIFLAAIWSILSIMYCWVLRRKN